MKKLLALWLLTSGVATAQYCAPAAYLKEIFGSGVTIAGTVANTTTTRQVIYTEADGTPQFDPMDQACGLYNVSSAAGGSIGCTQMKPNTTYYIHPSYDGSTHRGCQTETVAFDCNAVPNFGAAGAGEAACEIETDADGTNEVIKIRTPDDGALPPNPDPPVYSRTWDQGYTDTPDASATVATASSGGELLATDFLAKVTAAVDYLKANPTHTYTVTIPPTTRVRRENEGGVGVSANTHGFQIPACDGDETGMLIIESSTPDPDAMPAMGATPTGNEEWAHVEWNRNGVLTNTSPTLITYAEPACPVFWRGVTMGAPPHELKERWVTTGTATVTPGTPRENDSTLLDFTGASPDASDAWPTTANAGITVAGLKGDVFHNGTDAETGVSTATQWTRSGDTYTISGKAALGTAGAAKLHNIISLPFTSAAGAVLTTPAHPYLDSPQTDIVSLVAGVLTTSVSHGASYLSGGNTVWLQGTDNGAGGDCDGFYANISGGTPNSDSGRDTTTMSLQSITGATGASIPDCNTANGTVQIIGVAMLASDSYPDGIACYISFPSSTSVQLELCTETGLSTTVPDLTGETGYISYDPPTLPTIMTHPGGAPLHMTNVTIRANRPWRIERAIQLNGTGLTTEEVHITGIKSDIGLWVPSPPNPNSSGATSMTRISSYEFSQLLRLWGRSRVRLGPGRKDAGGFTIFGQEFGRPTPTDITLNQFWDVFPDRAVSGLSSIFEGYRQRNEGKSGFDRFAWIGNINIGAPEHNSPVSVEFTCKTNANNYNTSPTLTSTCSNLDFRWSFFSAPQLIKSGVTENGGASQYFEWTAYRKVRFSDNVVRMRARKGFLHGEHLTFSGYSATSFQSLPFVFTRTGDMAFDRNLWLPHLGTNVDSNGLWHKIFDNGVQIGSRFSWQDNIHVDNVVDNTAGGRFGGSWANAVESVFIADGVASPLIDVSGNPLAYCQNDSLDTDYTALVADACTRGATYWGAAGYVDAFDAVTCNTSEACATRAGRILDTATNEPLPAYSSKGPTGGIARVLDEMGVIRDVQVERRVDGTAARISYHAPAADRLCKTEWAEDGTDFDTVASGVSSVWDTAGAKERQVTLSGLSDGVSYDYRTRCELTAGSVRGGF